MTYKYEKKLNWAFAYLIFITVIAVVSIVGNAAQIRNYSESEKSYEREIQTFENTYQDLQKKYKTVNDKLNIITDEYNDLLEQNR